LSYQKIRALICYDQSFGKDDNTKGALNNALTSFAIVNTIIILDLYE